MKTIGDGAFDIEENSFDSNPVRGQGVSDHVECKKYRGIKFVEW